MHAQVYLKQLQVIASSFDPDLLEQMVKALGVIREQGGRLFFLGVGGSAANASHAVNDFRKIANVECYTPTDNVAEFSALINDEGWESSFAQWLRGCRLNEKDAVFVLS